MLINNVDFLILYLVGIGVTAGAHRLWCHKSYKAKVDTVENYTGSVELHFISSTNIQYA